MSKEPTLIANGNKPLSGAHKRKISDGLKNAYANGNRSKVVSRETRKKISKSLSGRTFSKERKEKLKGRVPWNKGKPLSEATKAKLSKAMSGKKWSKEAIAKRAESNRGKIESAETRRKKSVANTGERNPAWKGGISQENLKCRQGYRYKTWVRKVLLNWKCCAVCSREDYLVAHHLESFASNKELRFIVENGIGLRRKHHKEFHSIYGYGNNTKKQMYEYRKTKR